MSYGFKDFISNVGGLLGLFLGCSLLSLFELIFFPLKFIIENFRKRKNQVRPIEEENPNSMFADTEGRNTNENQNSELKNGSTTIEDEAENSKTTPENSKTTPENSSEVQTTQTLDEMILEEILKEFDEDEIYEIE